MKNKCFFLVLCLLTLTGMHLGQTVDNCSPVSPNVNTDCLKQSDSNNLCCYVTNDQQTSKKCQLISRVSFTVNLSVSEWNTDCGVSAQGRPVNVGGTLQEAVTPKNTNSLVLQMNTCGIASPSVSTDCSDYSTMWNSCCMFSSANQSGCYSLGLKYSGSQQMSYYSIACEGKLTQFSLGFLLILLIIFI